MLQIDAYFHTVHIKWVFTVVSLQLTLSFIENDEQFGKKYNIDKQMAKKHENR